MSIPEAAALVMRQFPSIDWDKPVAMTWSATRQRHACCICIAAYGFTCESAWQWEDRAEAENHIKEHFKEINDHTREIH